MAKHEMSPEFLTARDARFVGALAGDLACSPATITTPTTKTKTGITV
ncbi:hypothetical protein BN1012_Phect1289 [Candidatus Phaeomarinobacter ectocarpi]|uniref:Uncharacterized protein n=1 Tax=Candidatus Phaeomarinibacter ectocarpi TaxID=1458461 RepID=X5M896_9HYPH|nr:hypothetical protein [Candidatus Phaeomarinobacter ectocarpi]CDO59503.1 hypothetical protein BN1012_Phect1289 [Candidatus Phaeomarinobacter ectocarpi]